ncbi:hypothetical protein M758_11G092300 [Ceratodon purpureus]|uniref:Enoyl reductase (ER) domain-containing protein n=1 Tax=Ceratodon purpureus TaxID=3225 RepID=A0A8T0GDC5_CERPU|nr:hypothetical protein KC19_11G095200 [Ceratodon purpureus]KAG0601203.1 hypothetical protein M758_11G092300 [Ceratodon purpureus]
MDPTEGYDAIGYAAHDPEGELKPFKFKRRFPGPEDVVFDVTHCGICYAEIVWTKNFLGDVQYPVVPGHEVVGVVKEVGKNVTRFKPGDRVGVGYYVMSCRSCDLCNERQENYCNGPGGSIRQFNQEDVNKTITRGGFSNIQVTNERYVVHIPDALELETAAPLLCAGITVYSPLKKHGMEKGGKRVGVCGLGGLGHLAVRFAKAMGNHVTVLSTSESKKEAALNELGADAFIISKDQNAIQAAVKSLDLVIDCAAGAHPVDPFLSMLKYGGTLALVGFAPELKISPHYLCLGRTSIEGSITGGTLELQEMLNFAAEKGVAAMIEKIPIDYVNEAFARLLKNDVRYRFVVDVANSLKP